MSNLDEMGSNSLPLVQFVLMSDLSYFHERFSGFDGKDSFKDGLQGKIEVERSPKSRRKKLGKDHDRAPPTLRDLNCFLSTLFHLCFAFL